MACIPRSDRLITLAVTAAATATATAAAAVTFATPAAAATAAAAVTTAAATAAATVAAATAAAITTAATATAAIVFGSGFVDGQIATVEFGFMQTIDRGLSLSICRHFDKAKTLTASGFAVRNDLRTLDLTILREKFF
jgi:hypothetical protein